jgi:hypothetical protein
MKSYIHKFRTFGPISTCNVYIKEVDGHTWIGFQNGEGTSVTNASEQLASEIVDKENLNPAQCKFFEWYPEYEGDVSEVSYRWNDSEAFDAQWKFFCDADQNPFME